MESVGKVLGFLVLLAAIGDILLHEGWYTLPDSGGYTGDLQRNGASDSSHAAAAEPGVVKPVAGKKETEMSGIPKSPAAVGPASASSSSSSEFCTCPAEDVNENSGPLLRLLNRIVRRPFYRYYKVNTERACPFWAVELLCTSADSPCTLCACDAQDVPVDVRMERGDMSDVAFDNGSEDDSSVGSGSAAGSIADANLQNGGRQRIELQDGEEDKGDEISGDVTHGHAPAGVDLWGSSSTIEEASHSSSSSSRPSKDGSSRSSSISAAPGHSSPATAPFDVIASEPDGSDADVTEFVDLVLNPEGNTGYTGPMANRVWEAIYRENCLRDVADQLATATATNPRASAGSASEGGGAAPTHPSQCSELQVFFQLMSGFHASIGVNVAVNFHRIGYEEDEMKVVEHVDNTVESQGRDISTAQRKEPGEADDEQKKKDINSDHEDVVAVAARPPVANKKNKTTHRIPVYAPNCGMLKRLRSFEDRMENLQFLYQFVLRAVAKSSHSFLGTVAAAGAGSGDGKTKARRYDGKTNEGGSAKANLHSKASSAAFAAESTPSASPQEREATIRIHRSDNSAEDAALTDDLHLLFREKLLCSSTFDEVKFLQSPYAQFLLPHMRRMMKNVSLLMDCVACQKCRLWGKLEAQGIATALKAVMMTVDPITAVATPSPETGASLEGSERVEESKRSSCKDAFSDSLVDGGREPFAAISSHPSQSLRLRRGEMVSLMNLLRQLSLAVWSVQNLCLDS